MIDLHCHLLPGIDDGPQTMGQALELARLAVSNGISHSVLTPHIHPGRFDNCTDTITKVFSVFQQELKAANIPLSIGMAAEVRVSMEVISMIQDGNIPFLGELDGYDVMLLECPHSHILPGTEKLVDYLIGKNIRPLIAHPERNKEIIRSPNKLHRFIEAGCLLQVTADSLAGLFGPQAQTLSLDMLERDWIYLIASDAHSEKFRPPNLELGRQVIADKIGDAASWKYVQERPATIAHKHFPNLDQNLSSFNVVA